MLLPEAVKPRKSAIACYAFAKFGRRAYYATFKRTLDIPASVPIRVLTPLHMAAAENKLDEVINLLASDAPIDVRDYNGRTPLQYGANAGHVEIARFLLSQGADVDARDDLGGTALHSCSARPSAAGMIELLLAEGATIDACCDRAGGATPLHLAAQLGLLENVSLLVEHGARIDEHDDCGFKPIDYARQSDQVEVVKLLEDLTCP